MTLEQVGVPNLRVLLAFVSFLGLVIAASEAFAIDPYLGNDPYWVLLHEPAVVKDLRLDDAQQAAYSQLLDQLDLKFFPLRNKSADDATAGMAKISDEVKTQLKTLLKPEQLQRLNEILLQHLGNSSFLLDQVADRLKYTDAQRKRMKDIIAETDAALANENQDKDNRNASEPPQVRFVRLKTNEQRKLIAVLKKDQIETLKAMLGPSFPLAELRQPTFKAPELVNTNEWINSEPITLAAQRGKIIVLHFYAAGCINCIHNYPSYKQWHEQFQNKDVVLIGIHSPETSSERESANVRRKAKDEKLEFPILIDAKNENWDAWGNSMWPSVYLIDKRGYLRDFWPGELKWQGRDGEKYMRERIVNLLAEPAAK
ncbi:redoxin domain-containing protein [Schlesneria paludicola]|uniref:redoxin domain-containing protein n=1 Tax=Schlesneria paludicola TaxID=360056 RepID=UPI00029B1009|nr:redoxin domain-containing protein [Schlesneria paludicola]